MAGKLVHIKLHTRRSQRVVKESRSLCTCDCRIDNSTIPGLSLWWKYSFMHGCDTSRSNLISVVFQIFGLWSVNFLALFFGCSYNLLWTRFYEMQICFPFTNLSLLINLFPTSNLTHHPRVVGVVSIELTNKE